MRGHQPVWDGGAWWCACGADLPDDKAAFNHYDAHYYSNNQVTSAIQEG